MRLFFLKSQEPKKRELQKCYYRRDTPGNKKNRAVFDQSASSHKREREASDDSTNLALSNLGHNSVKVFKSPCRGTPGGFLSTFPRKRQG